MTYAELKKRYQDRVRAHQEKERLANQRNARMRQVIDSVTPDLLRKLDFGDSQNGGIENLPADGLAIVATFDGQQSVRCEVQILASGEQFVALIDGQGDNFYIDVAGEKERLYEAVGAALCEKIDQLKLP
jgi:hypothetical protein